MILPIGTFAETSGTYVNLEGRWQSVPGAAQPVGESRPGWKVLRVLGNLLEPAGLRLHELGSDHATKLRRLVDEAAGVRAKASTRTLQSKLALSAPAQRARRADLSGRRAGASFAGAAKHA